MFITKLDVTVILKASKMHLDVQENVTDNLSQSTLHKGDLIISVSLISVASQLLDLIGLNRTDN